MKLRPPILVEDLLCVALPLLLIYARTAAPDLGSIDSGELAVVCARLGIAHPTGYPLYTLLGRVAVLAGDALRPIVALNLLSALAASLAVWMSVAAARAVIGSDRWSPRIVALALGLNPVLWEQATGNEVYTLHLLFVALLLWAALRWMDRPRERTLLALGYLVGLSSAHHATVVFLGPGLALALIVGLRAAAISWNRIPRVTALLGAPFLLGVSALAYLPIRSRCEPLLDWGGTQTLSGFMRHVSAAQYRVWFLEEGGQWTPHVASYLTSLPHRLGWPVLALAVLGAAVLWRRRTAQLICLMLVAATTIAWASAYQIFDLAPYYLPSDLAIALVAAVGLSALSQWAGALVTSRLLRGEPSARTRSIVRGGILVALAGVVLTPGLLRWPAADRSGDRFVRLHAEIVLDALPPDAILLSRHWDALVSPALYLQAIEQRRTDVTVVDTELLRRSWYFPQLRRWDPALLEPLEPTVTDFLADLVDFEAGDPYDPAAIERNYRTVIQRLALAHRPARPGVYTLDTLLDLPPDQAASFFAPAITVPEGAVFRLYDDPALAPVSPPPDFEMLFAAGFRREDRIHQQVLQHWRSVASSRLRFLRVFEREAEATEWEDALRFLDAQAR